MNKTHPIGLMDWGVGGFSVYAALRAADRTDDVVYLSDAGNTSYGNLGATQMRARFVEIARFFQARGAREVLVGCNAASSALAGDIEEFEGVRFHSIIPAGVLAANACQGERIGVIGGEVTISSRVYQRRLTGPRFRFQSAQPLSGLVERGEFDGFRTESAIADVQQAVGEVDALLLACTHYPALADAFHRVAPGVELLDPAGFLLGAIPPGTGNSRVVFCTTGPAEAAEIARRAFGVEIREISLLDLALQEFPHSGAA